MINFIQYDGTIDQFRQVSKSGNYTDDSIVFIKGSSNGEGAAIYANGRFFANLEELRCLAYVKAGGKTAVAPNRGGTIEFAAEAPLTVDFNNNGEVEIGLEDTYKDVIQEMSVSGITTEELNYTVDDAQTTNPLRVLYIAEGAEYNNTNNFIIKTPNWSTMVDPVEYKAKWNIDVVDSQYVKKDPVNINGTNYRIAVDTRTSYVDGVLPRYRIVKCVDKQGDTYTELAYNQTATGQAIWVWDDTKVLHLPKHYYLEGLGDLTDNEMADVYNNKDVFYKLSSARLLQGKRQARVFFPVKQPHSILTQSISYYLFGSSTSVLEVFSPTGYYSTWDHSFGNQGSSTDPSYILCGNSKVRHMNMFRGTSFSAFTNSFDGTTSLVDFIINSLKCSVICKASSKISKTSILYTIKNATPTKAITITLHPDAHARLSEDQEIKDALAAQPLITLSK